jgi:hypothetical protein
MIATKTAMSSNNGTVKGTIRTITRKAELVENVATFTQPIPDDYRLFYNGQYIQRGQNHTKISETKLQFDFPFGDVDVIKLEFQIIE